MNDQTRRQRAAAPNNSPYPPYGVVDATATDAADEPTRVDARAVAPMRYGPPAYGPPAYGPPSNYPTEYEG
ncbi:MAG TPA: hypothetical protein VIC27_10560, partial [Ktedonobacterales bacterium]